MTISGTAADTGGGVVAGVEVSTDGGEDLAAGHRNNELDLQLECARKPHDP